MKKFTFLTFLLATAMGFSQINPINFETPGNGADWTFGTFANDDEPPLEIVSNPDPTGINTSSTVAKFTARMAGESFAGTFSDDIGMFTIDATNSTVKIKVYKPTISDVGIKIEGGPNAALGELKVPNTVINQWEELTFDFSSFIGMPSAADKGRITIFPDFIEPRGQDNIIYFDDITFSAVLGVDEHATLKFSAFPNPSNTAWTIKSLKSEITSLELYNIQGKQLLSLKTNAFETNIDNAKIPAGIYFARIYSINGSQSIKLVKN